MDIEARKIMFVQEFLRLQNENVIGRLEQLLRKERLELLENKAGSMTKERLNEEIDKALEDSRSGKMIKSTDLKAKIDQWD